VVVTGNPDIGGSRASMAIMCAEELGIEVGKVRPLVADTEAAPYTDVTGGSRVTFATGMAVIEACRQVVAELRRRAAKLWECEPEQVVFADGRCLPAEGAGLDCDPLSVAQIAARMSATGGPINGQAQLTPHAAGPSFATHCAMWRWIPTRAAWRCCATRRCRMPAAPCTPPMWKGKCRAALPRALAGRSMRNTSTTKTACWITRASWITECPLPAICR